ncbi:MAG: hypothetical protein AB2L20_12730 [Mangrovibacterium sp.]
MIINRSVHENNKKICKVIFGSIVLALPVSAQPTPLGLDVTQSKKTEINEIEGFHDKSPAGHTLAVNSRYFEKDGQPWIPVMGEFHYWRFPDRIYRMHGKRSNKPSPVAGSGRN